MFHLRLRCEMCYQTFEKEEEDSAYAKECSTGSVIAALWSALGKRKLFDVAGDMSLFVCEILVVQSPVTANLILKFEQITFVDCASAHSCLLSVHMRTCTDHKSNLLTADLC